LILTELEYRHCAYWNIYPWFYISSIGAHLFNVSSMVRQVLYISGLPYDTRMHIFLVTYPGFGKTFWLFQFLLPDTGLIAGTRVPVTFEGYVTEAGWVGQFSGAADEENPESNKRYGVAYQYATGIAGAEEFSGINAALSQSHSKQLDSALLTSLDSGYVSKSLGPGSIKYKTSITLWCVDPDTIVYGLGRDLPAKELSIGKLILNRYLHASKIQHITPTTRPCKTVITDKHELTVATKHPILTKQGWKRDDLVEGDWIAYYDLPLTTPDWQLGYLRGYFAGDGWIGKDRAFAESIDISLLKHVQHTMLAVYGYKPWIAPIKSISQSHSPRWRLGVTTRVSVLDDLYRKPTSYEQTRGWVAGFFDAEGHVRNDGRLTDIACNDDELRAQVQVYLKTLGIRTSNHKYKYDHHSASDRLHILDGKKGRRRLAEHIRPVLSRKLRRMMCTPNYIQVNEIVDIGKKELISLNLKGNPTFIANGIVTHNTGTQPARFDLTGGLGRRLTFMHFIPTEDDIELLRQIRREGFGKRHRVFNTQRVRTEINKRKDEISQIKDVIMHKSIYKKLNTYNIMPYEEPLFERMAIGYWTMRGNFNDTLVLRLDKHLEEMFDLHYRWRGEIKRGSEFSQVLGYLRAQKNGRIDQGTYTSHLYNMGYDVESAKVLTDKLKRLGSIKLDKGMIGLVRRSKNRNND